MSQLDYLFLAINIGQIGVSLFVVNQNAAIKINMQKLQIWIMQNFEPRAAPRIPSGTELPSLFDTKR